MLNKNHHISYKSILQRTLAFLFVTVLVYSCVRDDYSNYYVDKQNLDYTTTRLNHSDLEKMKGVLEKIEEFKTANKPKFQHRNSQQVAGFEVNTDNVLMLEKDGRHSINFEIIDENSEKLKNLVLNQQDDKSYIAYLIEYDLSEQERESLINDEKINLNGKVSLVLKDEPEEKITIVYELVKNENGDLEFQYSLVRNNVVLAKKKNPCGCKDKDNGNSKGQVNNGNFGISYFDFSSTHWSWDGGWGFGSSDGNDLDISLPGSGGGGGSNTPPLITIPILNPEPIDHIAELNKITDKDALTPFRAKIDEYVGMLDVTQVEAGIVYVKNTDGSYSVVEPIEVGFGHVSFPNTSTRAELRIHLHHNYKRDDGARNIPIPSDRDVLSFVTAFSVIYKDSKRDKWMDIVVTRNGLYAFRTLDIEKIIAFYNSLSDDIKNDIQEIYKVEVKEKTKENTNKECVLGCTEEQRLQIKDMNFDERFIEFIKIINQKYDIGIGLFKGTLNTETSGYDWQQVSD